MQRDVRFAQSAVTAAAQRPSAVEGASTAAHDEITHRDRTDERITRRGPPQPAADPHRTVPVRTVDCTQRFRRSLR